MQTRQDKIAEELGAMALILVGSVIAVAILQWLGLAE